MPDWLIDTIAWWNALAPEWAFLFVLPFLVALAAFLAHGWDARPRNERRKDASPAAPRRRDRRRTIKPTPRPH